MILKTTYYFRFIFFSFLDLIFTSLHGTINDSDYLEIQKYLYFIEEYFSAFFTIAIIFIIYKKIKLYEKENTKYNRKKVILKTHWLKNILYFGILISIIWFIMLLISQINSYDLFSNKSRYYLWIANSILIYYLGYLGIYHNGIFKERKKIRKDNIVLKKDKVPISSDSKFEEIKTVIKEEKLFLNPRLNLAFLAEKFNLNESYFSHFFNKNSTENFPAYINKIRVEESKNLLTNKSYSLYTIVSIGLEAGFNSKSAFYTAFKKETGITPTTYRKENLS